MTTPPNILQPFLPPNTVVPEKWDLFIPYFNRLYEDIALVTNNKSLFYTIPISTTPRDITIIQTTNLTSATPSTYGAFIICVSGFGNGQPTLTAALSKSAVGVAGVVTPLNSQVGQVAPWVGSALTITSTATNFQIAHNAAGQTGNFNIRIIGTQ